MTLRGVVLLAGVLYIAGEQPFGYGPVDDALAFGDGGRDADGRVVHLYGPSTFWAWVRLQMRTFLFAQGVRSEL